MDYPAPVTRLIDELRKLPGIGPKSAQRIAFHFLRGTREDATRLSEAIATLLDGIRTCSVCHAVTDQEVCAHCSDPARSEKTICVVEEPHDLVAIEKTRDFRGRYHVLHGALSPLQGIGPDELRIQGLLDRVRDGGGGGGHPRHEPHRGGGGDRGLPRPPPQAPRRPRHPHRHGRPRGLATWSGPTRSPWRRRSRAAGSTEPVRPPGGFPVTPGPRLNSLDPRATLLRSPGARPLYRRTRRNGPPREEDHGMAAPDIVMYEEEFNQIKTVISKLRIDANAKVVFLVDKNGQQIAAQGEIENLDTTSLASLTAGNVAATDGLARLIGEKEFSILFHEGERDNIHISIVAQRVILVVIFDERRSLGLVRLRVKKASGELNDVFARIMSKVERERAAAGAAFESPFAEITDDDIDSLFSE